MKSISDTALYKIELFLLGLTLFLLSFPRSWSLYPMWIFLFIGLIFWVRDFESLRVLFFKNWYLTLPPVIFFLVQVVNSIILSSPFILLMDRLMFFLIPILGFPFFSKYLFKSNLRKILLSYIAGISIIGLFFLIRLIYTILSQSDYDIIDFLQKNMYSFLSDGFSLYEHPTYFSLKIIWVFSIIYILGNDLRINKYVAVFIVFLLSINIFLLSSKAGLISWMIINILFLVFYLNKKVSNLIIKYLVVILFSGITFILIINNDRFKLYVGQVQINLEVDKIDWKNVDQRTREWFTAYNLIKQRPITGYGLGAVQDSMVAIYYKNQFITEAEKRLNAHNQFLESQVTFGIIGTISLLWLLLTPVIFIKRLKYKNLAIVFAILMSYYLVIESMFNRQWGIMFFVFFYCILVMPVNEDLKTIKD